MKGTLPRSAPPVCSAESQTHTTKLVSLLALGAGAVVMPQSGRADIIYTDLRSSPAQVGFTGGGNSFLFHLPGTAQFGFRRYGLLTCGLPYCGGSPGSFPRWVSAAGRGADVQWGARFSPGPGSGGFHLAAPQPFGAAWDQGLGLGSNVLIGWANTGGKTPATGYDHQYLAWQFKDSTQMDALRYGWVEVSLSITPNINFVGGPNVTIYGYAYDDAGVKPSIGQVPEPSSIALMVLGALTLGARGLRSWRRNRLPL